MTYGKVTYVFESTGSGIDYGLDPPENAFGCLAGADGAMDCIGGLAQLFRSPLADLCGAFRMLRGNPTGAIGGSDRRDLHAVFLYSNL